LPVQNESSEIPFIVYINFVSCKRNAVVEANISIPDLNERKQTLLMALVNRHIRDGLPVGSKAIAESGALQVSSATIRNIMAELEGMGVLTSPHTSDRKSTRLNSSHVSISYAVFSLKKKR